MSENEILVVSVYNSYGADVSWENKRIHSTVDFKCLCPNCKNETITCGQDFLYVPNAYPHVHFYCDKCEHEDKLFFLEKLENNNAYLRKNPLIGSDIEIYIDTSAIDSSIVNGDTIIVPVYNNYGIELSLENKRIHTDVDFKCTCPVCSNNVVASGKDFLYIPIKYPYVKFYCDKCSHEDKILYLEKLENDMAHFKKNNLFKEISLI